jgi:hypothetical protein
LAVPTSTADEINLADCHWMTGTGKRLKMFKAYDFCDPLHGNGRDGASVTEFSHVSGTLTLEGETARSQLIHCFQSLPRPDGETDRRTRLRSLFLGCTENARECTVLRRPLFTRVEVDAMQEHARMCSVSLSQVTPQSDGSPNRDLSQVKSTSSREHRTLALSGLLTGNANKNQRMGFDSFRIAYHPRAKTERLLGWQVWTRAFSAI